MSVLRSIGAKLPLLRTACLPKPPHATCRVMKRAFALVLCAALVFGVALSAQEKKQAESKKEEVFIGGEGTKWKMRGSEDERIYTITGNVVIEHLDTTLTANQVEYNEKTKIATAEGNLKIVDPESVITGKKGIAYFKERKTVIEGDVKLVTQPKKNGDAGGNPDSMRARLRGRSTITCDKMEYQYRNKVATAEGNLKVVQKDRTLDAKKAVYDVKQEFVTLTGGVHVKDEKGQTFTSPGTVKASLKEGAEWIEAENGSAMLKVNLEEEDEEGEKAENGDKGSN
ncbi:MAG: LPS-assembly protein LptD [Armatimonadetes bacterium]|nr:LPS-assembly protein LptD [Armatimonadota bacterium]